MEVEINYHTMKTLKRLLFFIHHTLFLLTNLQSLVVTIHVHEHVYTMS